VITSDNTDEEEIGNVNLNNVYDERFSTRHLHLFLKSMDRPSITMRMSKGRPLVIKYPLSGGEDNISCCNFILAPRQKDADEGDASDSD
jgi:hypothetical protein